MCPYCRNPEANTIRKGYYRSRTSHKELIRRYYCHDCSRSFSERCCTVGYRDRKPHLNQVLFRLVCSGMSQRRIADVLGIHRTTVARKIVKLGRIAGQQHRQMIASSPKKLRTVVFDEMETFEHTKMKPVSIEVMVEESSRRILGLLAARMPAKGRLAARSRKKYGPRKDDRPAAMRQLFRRVRPLLIERPLIKSDESPRYPAMIKKEFPGAVHHAYKGRRGCVVGQGELKAGGFDPLFSLNHTCAMVRDNLKTLTRRTWCTIKRPDRFQALLNLNMVWHNCRLAGERRPMIRWTPGAVV